jgi:uncharacterized cupin superfamily protein
MTIVRNGTSRVEQGQAGDPLGAYRAELVSDTAGLTQFGAFIEELSPGSWSSFAHWHESEDEMMMILSGEITLVENGVKSLLRSGDAACWRAGEPTAHRLYNHTQRPARYVVIGTRAPKDRVTYPDQDRILQIDRIRNTRRYTTLAGLPATKPEP